MDVCRGYKQVGYGSVDQGRGVYQVKYGLGGVYMGLARYSMVWRVCVIGLSVKVSVVWLMFAEKLIR